MIEKFSLTANTYKIQKNLSLKIDEKNLEKSEGDKMIN